jgi:acyl carrier protein|tara:strand:- start:182 stop:418 length:237 start_codon:yes stop_codon:yes gene_type:complete
MEIEVFLGKIKAEFNEDYDIGDLGLDDNIKNMDWWSSMHALVIIALIDTEYDVMLEPSQMKSANTVRELFTMVNNIKG